MKIMQGKKFVCTFGLYTAMEDIRDTNALTGMATVSDKYFWSSEEKWQTTNEIYTDFDSYINPHTKCPAVVSFADIILPKADDFRSSSVPATKIHGNIEQDNESSNLTVIERSIKNEKEGVLPSANSKRNSKLQQKLPRKHNKILAKENIIGSNYENITQQRINGQELQKPNLSFSYLTAMALNSSESGWMLVSEIYGYICKRFPYYKTAPSNWKNNIRHTLSTNKNFVKREYYKKSKQKTCLWSVDSSKRNKMDEQINKWKRNTHTLEESTNLKQNRMLF